MNEVNGILVIALLGIFTPVKLLALGLSGGCGSELSPNVNAGHTLHRDVQVIDPTLGEVTRSFRVHVPAGYSMDNSKPVPLVLDYHGWGDTALTQERNTHFKDVSDEDPDGFLVVFPNGMSDNQENWGSFNCSRTDGPLGPTCDTNRERWEVYSCYSSCPNCDPTNSCDWTSCHDDVEFTRVMIAAVEDEFCVNTDSIHQTGMSNGGMFSYYLASRLSGVLASMAPVSGSPLLGFGDLPDSPLSLIDIHGINDDNVPYDIVHSEGEGPMGTAISFDGFYYHEKPVVIRTWVEGFGCDKEGIPWKTDMDGVDDFACTQWSGCQGGTEVVSCTANHKHEYPFGGDIAGARIMWKFMKSHNKN